WNNNKYSVSIKELLRNDNSTSGVRGHLNIKTQKTEHQENGTFHAVSSLGLSTIYDFDTGSRFKPYIGMRVAYGHVRHQVRSVEQETEIITTYPSNGGGKVSLSSKMSPKSAHHQSNSIRRVGLGVIAGVGFDITPKLTLDTGYRYHNWGRLENTRFKTH
ncbi:outer membrane beta-barrel protein, partial [Neisseria gonorrhoeae]